MQKISKKSKEALYKSVSDDIMTARIKINIEMRGCPKHIQKSIDDYLFQLSVNAPKNAINQFNYS